MAKSCSSGFSSAGLGLRLKSGRERSQRRLLRGTLARLVQGSQTSAALLLKSRVGLILS